MPSARSSLVLPSLMLRMDDPPWREVVNVSLPRHPVVAFTTRDVRSPHIERAVAVARSLGFAAVVRSPGGRMVAYDAGAVVVDHVTRARSAVVTKSLFEDKATTHAEVLRGVSGLDLRVGELDGEYCPGEFSINVSGVSKVVGSAQRVTRTGWLFSTVVQVSMSDAVRAAIEEVSAALHYRVRKSTIAGLRDFAPHVTPDVVAAALQDDYRTRRGLSYATVPETMTQHVSRADAEPPRALPFQVDDWVRDELLAMS